MHDASNSTGYTDYASNVYEINSQTGYVGLVAPSQTVLACDMISSHSASSIYANYDWVYPSASNLQQADNRYTRHLGGDNFLFCDGHAKWLQSQTVKSRSDGSGNTYATYCGSGKPSSPTQTAYTFCPN